MRKINPEVHVKEAWGSPHTSPWFENSKHEKIGELWFRDAEAPPILVKFLFTSDKLSVQVHPEDEYAQAHGHPRGKTEMWHVLRAEPDSKVAIGLLEELSPERLRETAVSGEIERLLNWIPAQAGDTFFVPAGTIHAIGSGLVICEIQQLSDVTYRLYDYNREPKRELHLADSVAVSRLTPGPDPKTEATDSARQLLTGCKYFRTEALRVSGRATVPPIVRPTFCIVTAGSGSIGAQSFVAGEVFLLDPADSGITITAGGATILFAS